MGKKRRDMEVSTEMTEVTLQDFIVPAKIQAFLAEYKPLNEWQEGCDTFTDYQLRSYFKAVVCELGDPLALYLQALEAHDFKMKNDVCGEPVIYAMPR